MGKQYLGLVFYVIFISIIFITDTYVCLGAGNTTTVICSKQEQQSLLKFKHSVHDLNHLLSSWVGNDSCMWERVRCDGATGYVEGLNLNGRGSEDMLVANDVSHSLGELWHLKYLDLSGNDFQGCLIPSFIGSLKKLTYLDLSNSAFSGNIPHHIGNLSNLKVLDIRSNKMLMADDMAWISGLSSLKYLDLSDVDLSRAKNHDMVLHLIPSLVKLSLSRCGLSSTDLIPLLNSSITLSKIRYLDLRYNHFYGQVPHVFQNMTSLEFLDLSFFNLSGAPNPLILLSMIPSLLELHLSYCSLQEMHLSPSLLNMSTLSNIQHLDLSRNLFNGRFPSIITNMTSLLVLDLHGSSLNSSVPVMRNLLELDLSYNHFKHIEQVGIWRQCHLRVLRVSHNSFPMEMTENPLNISECSKYAFEWLYLDSSVSGTIPESFGRMANLIGLDLSNSELTGSIPESLGSLRLLRELYVEGNDLTGSIPNFHGKLTRLNLAYNRLNGLIPESFGRLNLLEVLDLSMNELTGPIPSFHGKLTRLELRYNRLNGLIPESFGRLSLLEVLDLSKNELTGPIPILHGKLTVLDLSKNHLSGFIPQSLGRLKLLEVLDLSKNELTGPIPTFLLKLTSLDLSYNYLNGSIPESVGRLVSLELFSVSSNLLNGNISASIGKLTKLQYLDVSNNSLEGVVTEAHFANLSMLTYLDSASNSKLAFNVSREWIPPFHLYELDLSSCKIEGGFPQWVRSQRNLVRLTLSNATISGLLPTWLGKLPINELDLSHNKLSGPLIRFNEISYVYLLLQNNYFSEFIPRSLCTCATLEVLDLSRNRFTGRIPNCLGNLQLLFIIKFSSNRLSGVIPTSLGNISSLSLLSLNENNFIGALPQELANLEALDILDLGDNEFSGNIPEWIGDKLSFLVVLRLHNNNFTGGIPRSLCQMSSLQILDVSHNNLSGLIPHCLGELESMVISNVSQNPLGQWGEPVTQVIKGVTLEYTKTLKFVFNMDLSSNKLVGEIPVEITALRGLVGLNLSNNHLSGNIPENIGDMKALNSLDFSRNELTGSIPPSLAALNFLSHLNLSHNNLSGRIPTGNQLQTLIDPSIYVGNKDLCGAPLQKNCFNQEDPTTRPKKNDKKAHGSNKAWLNRLEIISGFVTGFWGVIGVLVLKKHWRHNLFMLVETTINKTYVVVMIRVSKIRRKTEAA